jgi:hypothetical protein
MNLIFFKKNEKKENGGRRINVIDKKIIKWNKIRSRGKQDFSGIN